MKSPIEVLLHVARVLDGLNVPYLVGGSVASSLQGFPRTTNDADIVADIALDQVLKIFTALNDEFYIDDRAIRMAVLESGSFNVIHFDSLFKIDVYIPDKMFGQQQLRRRRTETLLPDSTQTTYMSSPEDTILAKLSWYRKGGEVSQRQLADVAGIIKVQGQTLDVPYLREWADKLNVLDLLEQVLEEIR
ncbi:MAG TPA: hypothetical protein VN256_11810 [Pyrinomonadaceae bacterium]|nr:hypothetical protein [Pyrinomonadaceae bacterium]